MTSIIDSCKNILEKHRVNIDNINNFNRVELGTICNPEYGFTASSSEKGKYRYIRITDISSSGLLKSEDKVYVTPNENVDKRFYLNEGDLLVARTGATYGKTLYWSDSEPAIYASYLIKLNFDNSIILNKYYWYYTMTDDYIRQKEMYVGGGTQPQFNANAIRKIKIPIPDTLEQQKKIILKCETQFNRILEIEELMKQYEIDLKIQLKKIWGEEE